MPNDIVFKPLYAYDEKNATTFKKFDLIQNILQYGKLVLKWDLTNTNKTLYKVPVDTIFYLISYSFSMQRATASDSASYLRIYIGDQTDTGTNISTLELEGTDQNVSNMSFAIPLKLSAGSTIFFGCDATSDEIKAAIQGYEIPESLEPTSF